MELARRLRKLGIFTLVGKNDQCLSACVYAFVAAPPFVFLALMREALPAGHKSASNAA